ncbi:MAG: hypothetical protein IJ246_05235 [Clostridia bacterium]|nr:hypothetical protein [Clostridia bacterium]
MADNKRGSICPNCKAPIFGSLRSRRMVLVEDDMKPTEVECEICLRCRYMHLTLPAEKQAVRFVRRWG